MATKVTGRVEVLVNGVTVLNKSGWTAENIGESGKPAVKRTPIVGDGGLHGYKEEIQPARCSGKITDRDDINLSTMAAINSDGTVVFRAANGGKVYTMHNATCEGALKLTAGEGDVDVAFIGPFWTETTSST
jgi:hypothetical protein